MYICIDFDGTIVEYRYPKIGNELPLAIETIKELQQKHKIILNTMRSGKELDEAVNFLRLRGVELFGINNNPTQSLWTSSPKVYGNIYIDDAALGCPLKNGSVDWIKIRELLKGQTSTTTTNATIL